MRVAPPLQQISITYTQWIICVQYLRILHSSFGEEDIQRFALNLMCSNSTSVPGYYFANYSPRTICLQYLRILLSSFGEEDF